MKLIINVALFYLLALIPVLMFPAIVSAGPEGSIETRLFNIGDSKSKLGSAQVGTTGVMIDGEYKTNHLIFSAGIERLTYSWKNPSTLPFSSGMSGDPWASFNVLKLGFAYEHYIDKQWEYTYYIETESSYEEQISRSYRSEAGIKFLYEPTKTWAYTLVLNLENTDAEGADVGYDIEIEWNGDTREGWSAKLQVSTQFPESMLSYHFTRSFTTSIFYLEGGTNLVRLSDTSPVPGFQGGYVEDQYTAFGILLDYEMKRNSNISLAIQTNSGREFTFLDKNGDNKTKYKFDNSSEISIQYSQEF